MDYTISSNLDIGQSSDFLQLELLAQDFKANVMNKIAPDLHPRLLIQVSCLKGNDKDIVLSYTIKEWRYFVFIITKGDDLLAMAKRLFEKLLSFFE